MREAGSRRGKAAPEAPGPWDRTREGGRGSWRRGVLGVTVTGPQGRRYRGDTGEGWHQDREAAGVGGSGGAGRPVPRVTRGWGVDRDPGAAGAAGPLCDRGRTWGWGWGSGGAPHSAGGWVTSLSPSLPAGAPRRGCCSGSLSCWSPPLPGSRVTCRGCCGMPGRGVPAAVPRVPYLLPVLKPPIPWEAVLSRNGSWSLPSGQMLRPVVIPKAGGNSFNGHIPRGCRARGVPCASSHQRPGMLGKSLAAVPWGESGLSGPCWLWDRRDGVAPKRPCSVC